MEQEVLELQKRVGVGVLVGREVGMNLRVAVVMSSFSRFRDLIQIMKWMA